MSSKGTRVRSIRISDQTHRALADWGERNLGTRKFTAVVKHLIDKALGGK